MDYRAMLQQRRYKQWEQDKANLEPVDLKEVEKPLPTLKKVERVSFCFFFSNRIVNFLRTDFFCFFLI